MLGTSGSTVITYNGEVYNYLELREQLLADGLEFRGTSDTEVLLALYEKHGSDFVRRLRGMFAFALWDGMARQLLLARDRLGKKPLYYCRVGPRLYFGSEIKAILAGLGGCPEMDLAALEEYLTFGFIGGERTIYRGICELQPGCLLVATAPGDIRVTRFWKPDWRSKRPRHLQDAVDEADRLLTEAIRLRLRADVPVGIFLSGGIDSGLITAITAKNLGRRCLTFSVGFEDATFDERPLARQVAQGYGTDHHEIVLRPDVASLIPKLAWHHDEPFADPSAIPAFAVASEARKQVKVVLNGDGGDELFAGYRRHLAAALATRLGRWVPAGALRQAAGMALACLPRPASFRSPYALCHRFLRGLSGNGTEGMTAWFTEGFTVQETRALYRDPPFPEGSTDPLGTMIAPWEPLSHLDRALGLDLIWHLPGTLLVKMDIATMAYGLEARSPFLDHELVEWACALPEPVRLPGLSSTKPILRTLARRYLPPSVVEAPKRGFEVPLNRWLRQDLREMRDDLILSADGLACRLFHRSKLERVLAGREEEPGRWAQRVWTLLMLAAWERYAARPAAFATAVGSSPSWIAV
jgi:asparagine synthase (glutamine-hydrolysing)